MLFLRDIHLFSEMKVLSLRWIWLKSWSWMCRRFRLGLLGGESSLSHGLVMRFSLIGLLFLPKERLIIWRSEESSYLRPRDFLKML